MDDIIGTDDFTKSLMDYDENIALIEELVENENWKDLEQISKGAAERIHELEAILIEARNELVNTGIY